MSDNDITKNNKRKRQPSVPTSAKSPVLSSTPPSNATATVAVTVSVEGPPGPLPSQPSHLHSRSKGFVTPDQRLPASPPLPTAAPTIMTVVRQRCNAALNMLFGTQPIVLNQPCNLSHNRLWRQQQQQQQHQQQQNSLRPSDNPTSTTTSNLDSTTSRTDKLQQVQPQWRRRHPSPTHQQQQQDHQPQQHQQQQQQHDRGHDHQPDSIRKSSTSSPPHTLPSIPPHSTTSSPGSVSPLPPDHAAVSITRVSKRRRTAVHTDQVVPDSTHLTSSPYAPTCMPHSSLPSPNAGADADAATSDMSDGDNNNDSHNHASPRLSLSPNAHYTLSRLNSQSPLPPSSSSPSPSPSPPSPTTLSQPSKHPSVPYVPQTPSPTSGTITIDHLHQQQQLEALSSRQRPTSQHQQQLTQSSNDKIPSVVLASTAAATAAAAVAAVPTTPKPAMTSTPLSPPSPPLSLLCDEEHCFCANSMWTSAGIGPEVMLRTAEDLSDTIMRMYGRGIDMSTNDIDYARLSKSVAFRRYLTCARKLRYFDPLLLNDKDRKAFFLNVYNSLMIHAITAISKPRTTFDRVSLYNSAAYNIGGRSYTLNMIEHGVLRANKCGSGPFAQTPFALSDARRLCSLPDVDPRIHFALNCGAKSCPPVRFYEAHSLDAALDAATRAYLLDIEVDTKLRKIMLPKLLQWYKMDFCHNGDVDLVLEWTLPYLTDDKKKVIEQFLWEKRRNGLQFKVAYSAYDWTVNDISNST